MSDEKRLLVLSNTDSVEDKTIKTLLNKNKQTDVLFCGSGIEKLIDITTRSDNSEKMEESLRNVYHVREKDELDLKNHTQNHLMIKPFVWNGWTIVGIDDASFYYDRKLSNKEVELLDERHFQTLSDSIKNCEGNNNVIVISYRPPYGCLDLMHCFDSERLKDFLDPMVKRHGGSKAFRSIIEMYSDKIKMVICGYNDLFGGYLDYINDIPIINISNKKNRFAYFPFSFVCNYVDLLLSANGELKFSIQQQGINWMEITGIKTYYHLLEDLPQNVLTDKDHKQILIPKQIKEKIELYNEYIKRNRGSILDIAKITDADGLNKIPKNVVFIDLETSDRTIKFLNLIKNENDEVLDLEDEMLDEPMVVSISLFHRDTKQAKYFSLFDIDESVGNINERVKMLVRKCEEYLSGFRKVVLYSHGSFDNDVLSYLNFKYKVNDQLPILRETILLPNYALKSICNYLGVNYDANIRDGQVIGVMNAHLVRDNCEYCKHYLKENKDHNIDDVKVMDEILTKIEEKINKEKKIS